VLWRFFASGRAKLLDACILVLRNLSLLILTIVLSMCSCTSGYPPAISAPLLPLALRIALPQVCKYPEEGNCLVYENVPWNEWKNPRLILTSAGVKVLLPGSLSSRIAVPPRSVGDVLEKTEVAEWPMGLIVMVEISGVWESPDMLQRDRSELLNTLSNHGVRMVWGAPAA
jgi:hypothetical protein